MSLLSLPNEVLLIIATPLQPSDLKHLLEANRRLCKLLTPQLHKYALHPKGILPALHWGVLRNYEPLVKLILDTCPWLIDQKDNDGWTALHYAGAQGRTGIVRILLERGADTTQRNNIGESALEVTPEFGSEERFGLLLQFPAHRISDDKRPVEKWHQWQGAGEYVAITHLLIEHGANVDNQDYFGRTPLHWATRSGLLGVVRALLENGANVDIRSRDGDTPLIWATENFKLGDGEEQVGIVKLLLDHGAERTVQNSEGYSLLNLAIAQGSIEVTRLLLENGNIDVNQVDRFGRSALVQASSVVALIEDDPRPIKLRENAFVLFSMLLKNGADVNAADSEGYTALHTVALAYKDDLVQLLLENGADPQKENTLGEMPVDTAVQSVKKDKGSKDMTITLLRSAMCRGLHGPEPRR